MLNKHFQRASPSMVGQEHGTFHVWRVVDMLAQATVQKCVTYFKKS